MGRAECTLHSFAGTDPPDLLQGGDLPSVTDVRRPRLYLLQWLKSDKALMMLFNDGTFQVSVALRGGPVGGLEVIFTLSG